MKQTKRRLPARSRTHSVDWAVGHLRPRSHQAVWVVLVLGLASFFSTVSIATPRNDNLQQNGGFEEELTGWHLSAAFEPATVEVVEGASPSVAHTGRHAIRVRNDGGWSHLYHEKKHPLPGKRVFELSFWVHSGKADYDASSKPIQASVSVNIYEYGNYDLPGPEVFLDIKQRLPPKPVREDWHRIHVGFLMPGGKRIGVLASR